VPDAARALVDRDVAPARVDGRPRARARGDVAVGAVVGLPGVAAWARRDFLFFNPF
jgi:hypothetical protein